MFKDSLSVNEFLCQESRGGKHGKTSILQFLGLHSGEFLRVSGLQAKGVEVQVTRDVFITEESGFGDRDVLGLDPADFGAGGLGLGNTSSQEDPEDGVDLGEVGDGRARDFSVEEDSLALDGFADKETDGGQHGNASVSELGFTVSLKGHFIGLGGETSRVEKTNRGKGTGDGVDSEGLKKFDSGR